MAEADRWRRYAEGAVPGSIYGPEHLGPFHISAWDGGIWNRIGESVDVVGGSEVVLTIGVEKVHW